MSEPASNAPASLDFIREMIAADLAEGRNGGQIVTRFPPEPNGYLHIGHAKSICLNFGLAQEHAPNARCHLRFDDTNPTKEEVEYVESIKADVKWLGFDWGEHMFFASDYFEKLYLFAEQLISKGLAYVDDQSQEEMRLNRGTLTTPGTRSVYADRTPEENLDLFRRMRKGEFKEGEKVLRAKIDMASQNMHLRDPALYRILHAHHHRTGDAWCIYPMYDYAHPLSDALESITHSLCTLEFEVHRPLYEWLINNVDGLPGQPYQREFARLNLSYTVMSKRKLLRLVKDAAGNITELRCTYDEATRHGVKPEGRPKPKGIIHWVSARHAIDAPVRLYDRLFTVETPDADAGEDGDFTQFLNPPSLEVLTHAKLEPSLKDAAPGSHWQFERVAYFYADPVDSKPGAPVFNRTVSLKDGWTPAKK